MSTSFTPLLVIKKRRHQLLAGFLLLALVSSTTYYLTLPAPINAATTYTWTTNADWAAGSTASTSIDTSPDNVTLSLRGTSTVETSEEQFLWGGSPYGDPYSILVEDEEGGEIILGQDLFAIYMESEIIENGCFCVVFFGSSTPVGSDYVIDAFISGNLLYVVTLTDLAVIDTQGTTDPNDDTFLTAYNSSSSPALVNTQVMHAFKESDLLYISTWEGGLSVIDTQGTTDPNDDTLVTRYHTGSTPAISNDNVVHAFKEGDLLYLNTRGGVSVIDTEGTTDPSDDTLVITYNTGSSPALGSNTVSHSFLAGNLLYVGTDNGLSVIDTKGTVDPSDDTLVTTYNAGSTPALLGNYIEQAFLTNDILYVTVPVGSLFGQPGGLSVIDTKGTVDPSDDTLLTTYNTGSTPALGSDSVSHALLDGDLLYVGTRNGGLSVIDTKGTTDPNDDTLIVTYDLDSDPPFGSGLINIRNFFRIDSLLYVVIDEDLVVIDTLGNHAPAASYISSSRNIADTPTDTLSFERTVSAGQDVSLQYRTGDSEAAWVNNFDNGTTTEYLGDFYAWGSSFNDAVESGGTMRLSNPVDAEWAAFLFDTGKPDDYFPLGSKVTARIRINSDTAIDVNECMFNDDYWDDDGCPEVTLNEWFTTSFVAAEKTFSKIGFYPWWNTGTWAPTDTFEIDWIQIELPDSFGHWNAWSTPCTDNTSCPIDPADLVGNDWIQYKLNLTTSDPYTTPAVNSVTWESGYESSGTYTSNTKAFTKSQDLLTFDVDVDMPTGTAVTYAYTLNGGETWRSITSGAQFPAGTTAQSFAWKATLTTTDSTKAPVINSVTLTTITHQNTTTTSTSVAIRAAKLEAQGKLTEAEALREKYNNRQFSDADIQREIITILAKTIEILKRMVELGG